MTRTEEPTARERTPSRALRFHAACAQLFQRATDGQVLVMVGIAMPVLLAFAALATDTGFIWMNRRSLQNAADAAALAGVQELPTDPTNATAFACDFGVTKNGVPSMYGKSGTCGGIADISITTTYVANDTITATVYKRINPIFGIAVGFGTVEIGAKATALVGSIAASCPFPIFQTPEVLPGGSQWSIQFYTLAALHLSAETSGGGGNFLTVDVGSGQRAVRDAMINNNCGNPIGSTAATQTGNAVGPVGDGFQWRLACATGGPLPNQTPACPGPSACPDASISPYLVTGAGGQQELSPAVTRDNCTRLVVIPIFPGPIASYTGHTTVPVLGFALFYIAGYCPNPTCSHPQLGELKKNQAYGYYVRSLAESETYVPYNGFGTKVPVLIE
jgi:hypothetical protein